MSAWPCVPSPLLLAGLAAGAVTLSACQPATTTAQKPRMTINATIPVDDPGILAFRDICMASAPSYHKAELVTRRFGIYLEHSTRGASGSTADKSLTVRLKPNKECVVTTPLRPTGTTRDQFYNMALQLTNTPPGQLSEELRGNFRGRTYLFSHQRGGEEVYQMVNVETPVAQAPGLEAGVAPAPATQPGF